MTSNVSPYTSPATLARLDGRTREGRFCGPGGLVITLSP